MRSLFDRILRFDRPGITGLPPRIVVATDRVSIKTFVGEQGPGRLLGQRNPISVSFAASRCAARESKLVRLGRARALI
jgi:hypothetical protein